MQMHYVKLIFLILISAILTGCSGRQAALEENQAVTQIATPDVADNNTAVVGWRASSSGSKTGGAHFEPVIEGDSIFVSSQSGQIARFSLASGERALNIKLDDRLASGVGVNAGSIFAVNTTGEVIALDRKDGSEKWRQSIGRSLSAAPAVNQQLVVIRTLDGQIIGLNAVTGEQVWALERPVASLSIGLDAPSLLAGEGAISGFSSGRVLANNVFNGGVFWEKRAFRPAGKNEIERLIDIDAAPVLAGQVVLVGAYQGGIVAYRLRNGDEVWRNAEASTRKSIAISGERLAITGPQSEVSMLDLVSGERLWEQRKLQGHGLTAPIFSSESVVVGNIDGVVYFLDASDGAITSQLRLGKSPITALKAVDQGFIAYSGTSGALILIEY